MRRLILSRPKWSSSSTFLACAMSMSFCGSILPRQLGEPLEVGAQHRALGAAFAHALQALQLLAWRACSTSSGMPASSIAFFSSSSSARRVLVLAELLLDLAHLLAQHVLALALVELLLASCRRSPSRCAARRRARRAARAPCRGARSRSKVSSSVLLLLVLDVEQVARPCRRAAPARSMPCTTTASSSGAFGRSWIASTACAFSCRKRASISAGRVPSRGPRRTARARPGTASPRGTRARGSASGPAPPGGARLRRR